MYVCTNKILCFCFFCLLIFLPGCKKETPPEKVLETGTLTDVDGNVYNTVKIGEQWWMAENLKVRSYDDGSPITEVMAAQNDTAWANKTSGAFCNLDSRYGLHYNWFAVSSTKRIAPKGWHVPTDEDWKTLERELGMDTLETEKTSWRGTTEGEKLLPEASTGWPASVTYGTNESGFSALPGGCRLFNGKAGEVAITGFWWSSTRKDKATAWYRNLAPGHSTVFRYYADKRYGLTIRCVKDRYF